MSGIEIVYKEILARQIAMEDSMLVQEKFVNHVIKIV
jgi:hypothetical protein